MRVPLAFALLDSERCSPRCLISVWFASHRFQSFHLETFMAKIVGCLAIIRSVGLSIHTDLPLELRIGLVSGMLGLGRLTILFSFSMGVVRLLKSGQLPLTFAYLGGRLAGGLFATWAGLSFARL